MMERWTSGLNREKGNTCFGDEFTDELNAETDEPRNRTYQRIKGNDARMDGRRRQLSVQSEKVVDDREESDQPCVSQAHAGQTLPPASQPASQPLMPLHSFRSGKRKKPTETEETPERKSGRTGGRAGGQTSLEPVSQPAGRPAS